jgi:hypothetical protein
MDLTVAPTLTPAFFGPSGIFVGRCSRSRTQPRGTSTSKTPDSIQVDQLFRKVETSVFSLFANQIPILLFEYEYEKNQWYELPATMMPEGPLSGLCSTNQALSKPSNIGQDCGIYSSQQTYRSAKVRGSYRC